MSTLATVVTIVINTVAFIGCIWWAYWAMRQLGIPRRFNMPVTVSLLVVLAVGSLVYTAVARVLGGLYGVFETYNNGWVRAFDILGGLAVLAFVGWLYARTSLEK